MRCGAPCLLRLPRELLRDILLEVCFIDLMQIALVSKALRNVTFDILGERRATLALSKLYSLAQRILHFAPLPVSYDLDDRHGAVEWLDTNKWTVQARGPTISTIGERPFLIRCQLRVPRMEAIQGLSCGIEALVIDSEYPYFPLNFARKVEIDHQTQHKFLRIVKIRDLNAEGCTALLDARHLPCVLLHVVRNLRYAMPNTKEGQMIARMLHSHLVLSDRITMDSGPTQRLSDLWADLCINPIRTWTADRFNSGTTTQKDQIACPTEGKEI